MSEKIAIIFDFDDTLSPDTTSGFLKHLGINTNDFWRNEVMPLVSSGWDQVPAYLYKMKEISDQKTPITQEMLINFGNQVKYYNGVVQLFDALRGYVEKNNKNVTLEFYLLSSGLGDLLKNTSIATEFTAIRASDFIYDSNNKISFPKNVVSFTDKTRYLFEISKGILAPNCQNDPFAVNKKVSQFRIPFEQMIVIGDGLTDIPCFSLVRKNNGVAIGVYDRNNKEKMGKAWGFIEDGRVNNLHSTNYNKDSDLYLSLQLAIDNIIKKIELKKTSYQG